MNYVLGQGIKNHLGLLLLHLLDGKRFMIALFPCCIILQLMVLLVTTVANNHWNHGSSAVSVSYFQLGARVLRTSSGQLNSPTSMLKRSLSAAPIGPKQMLSFCGTGELAVLFRGLRNSLPRR